MTTEIWTPRSTNGKTGDVPTLWVGETKEQTRKSCIGCAHLDNGCYAWKGRVSHGLASTQKSYARGVDKSLKTALAKSARGARMARLAAIGDPSALGRGRLLKVAKQIKRAGLDVVGYTAHWSKNDLSDVLLASVTKKTVRRAYDMGYKVAITLPRDHKGKTWEVDGVKGRVCPAQLSKRVTCNTCRMCKVGAGPNIGFITHD